MECQSEIPGKVVLWSAVPNGTSELPRNGLGGVSDGGVRFLQGPLTGSIITRTVILFVLVAFSTGCRFAARRDVDGNDPVDVACRFVEFARTGDIARAASCWREGDVRNIEANRLESFAQFCEYFRSETYTLHYEGADKGVYWVRFFGKDGGKTRARLLFLDSPSKSKDNRWKLRETLWIKRETEGVESNGTASVSH